MSDHARMTLNAVARWRLAGREVSAQQYLPVLYASAPEGRTRCERIYELARNCVKQEDLDNAAATALAGANGWQEKITQSLILKMLDEGLANNTAWIARQTRDLGEFTAGAQAEDQSL